MQSGKKSGVVSVSAEISIKMWNWNDWANDWLTERPTVSHPWVRVAWRTMRLWFQLGIESDSTATLLRKQNSACKSVREIKSIL